MDGVPRSELMKSPQEIPKVKDSVVITNPDAACIKSVSPLISRRKRDVAKDMEALILSRQDDPFLQTLASRENKNEDAEMNDDLVCLIPGSNKSLSKAADLTVLDVHEHMIRSPPPSMLSIGDVEFYFPVNRKPNQVKNNL